MPNNACIVIPANVHWDWSTDYINQTALYLSRKNKILCFFWLHSRSVKEHILHPGQPKFFSEISHNILAYHMVHLFPFRRYKPIYLINIYINIGIVLCYVFLQNLSQHFSKKILWFFDPIAYDIIRAFPRSWTRVYDCIDYFTGDVFTGPEDKLALQKKENELIRTSDICTVISHALLERHRRIRKDIVLVPQGFRLNIFQNTRLPAPRLSRGKPMVGYIGAINYRLDYHLLVEVVKQTPAYDYVFVGPIQDEETPTGRTKLAYAKQNLFTTPNVRFMPAVSKEMIPGIIRQFDIAIIPYDASLEFNTYCYPMKIMEYFYMGKPVVSTPIIELGRYKKFVHTARNAQEFTRTIRNLIQKRPTRTWRYKARSVALANTWEKKIEAISKMIGQRSLRVE